MNRSRLLLLLTTFPFLMGALPSWELSGAFATVGDVLQAIVENDSARFFLIIVIVYTLIYGIISQAIRNINFFGGQGDLPTHGKTFAFAVTLMVTMAVGYTITVGPLAGFGEVSTIVPLALLLGGLAAFGMKRKGASAHSTGMVAALVVFAFGYFIQSMWINIVAFVIFLFSFFSMISAVHLKHASPYSSHHAGSGERRKWYHEFGRWARDFGNDVKKGAQLGQEVTNRASSLFKREKKRKEEKEWLERLRKLDDEEFKKLSQVFNNNRNIQPSILRDMIERAEERSDKEYNLLQNVDQGEEQDLQTEDALAQRLAYDDASLHTDEREERKLGTLGAEEERIKEYIHNLESMDEGIRHDLQHDEDMRRKVHRHTKKELHSLREYRKHLLELKNLLKAYSTNPSQHNKEKIESTFRQLKKAHDDLRKHEIEEDKDLDKEYMMSYKGLREAYQRAQKELEKRKELSQRIQELERNVQSQERVRET